MICSCWQRHSFMLLDLGQQRGCREWERERVMPWHSAKTYGTCPVSLHKRCQAMTRSRSNCQLYWKDRSQLRQIRALPCSISSDCRLAQKSKQTRVKSKINYLRVPAAPFATLSASFVGILTRNSYVKFSLNLTELFKAEKKKFSECCNRLTAAIVELLSSETANAEPKAPTIWRCPLKLLIAWTFTQTRLYCAYYIVIQYIVIHRLHSHVSCNYEECCSLIATLQYVILLFFVVLCLSELPAIQTVKDAALLIWSFCFETFSRPVAELRLRLLETHQPTMATFWWFVLLSSSFSINIDGSRGYPNSIQFIQWKCECILKSLRATSCNVDGTSTCLAWGCCAIPGHCPLLIFCHEPKPFSRKSLDSLVSRWIHWSLLKATSAMPRRHLMPVRHSADAIGHRQLCISPSTDCPMLFDLRESFWYFSRSLTERCTCIW